MIYKQKEFIKLVAEESGYYQNAIKDILDGMQVVFERLLSEATPNELVSIKPLEGLTIGTRYYPAKNAMNPKTGEKIVTEAHIYPIATYTQAYQLKIRDACKENMGDGL